jgi:hypothetical protein
VTISATPLPRIQFVAPTSSGDEGDGLLAMEVSIVPMPTADVVIRYGLSGTASFVGGPTGHPADHDLIDQTQITFPAGTTTDSIDAMIAPDPFDEFDEDAIVTLNGISGVIVEGNIARTHHIMDDDAEPTVTFELQSSSTVEPNGVAAIVVSLSEQSGKPITVDFTVAGAGASPAEPTDFGANTLPLLFAPHAGPQVITVNVIDDAIDEDPETVDATLTNATNAVLPGPLLRTHVLTIDDEDPSPKLVFALPGGSPLEWIGTHDATVSLSVPSPERTVQFEISLKAGGTAGPGDFLVSLGPYTIAPGSPSTVVPVAITNDIVDEEDETFGLTLVNLVAADPGSQINHDAIIIDDDPILVSFDPIEGDTMALEGDSGNSFVNYRVLASAPPPQAINVTYTVAGTATCGSGGGTDCSVPASPITIVAGTSSRNLVVTIRGDTTVELDEDIVITLTGASGAGSTLDLGGELIRTHTIQNDDVP